MPTLSLSLSLSLPFISCICLWFHCSLPPSTHLLSISAHTVVHTMLQMSTEDDLSQQKLPLVIVVSFCKLSFCEWFKGVSRSPSLFPLLIFNPKLLAWWYYLVELRCSNEPCFWLGALPISSFFCNVHCFVQGCQLHLLELLSQSSPFILESRQFVYWDVLRIKLKCGLVCELTLRVNRHSNGQESTLCHHYVF